MSCLALEQGPDRLGVDPVRHQQFMQIQEITALDALHDAAQLLCRNLLERVNAAPTLLLEHDGPSGQTSLRSA